MLNVILRIEKKDHFLVSGHLIILLVGRSEVFSVHYLYYEDDWEDKDKHSDNKAKAEADIGNMTDLG